MRSPSPPSIVAWLFLMAFAACEPASQAPLPAASARPWALANAVREDEDRIWLMVRHAGWTKNCDPEGDGSLMFCEEGKWRLIALLNANGVPEARYADLLSREFWSWFHEKERRIAECKVKTPRRAEDARVDLEAMGACDPYTELTERQERSISSVLEVPASVGGRINEWIPMEQQMQRVEEELLERARQRAQEP